MTDQPGYRYKVMFVIAGDERWRVTGVSCSQPLRTEADFEKLSDMLAAHLGGVEVAIFDIEPDHGVPSSTEARPQGGVDASPDGVLGRRPPAVSTLLEALDHIGGVADSAGSPGPACEIEA
jgi:hypothetical protein